MGLIRRPSVEAEVPPRPPSSLFELCQPVILPGMTSKVGPKGQVVIPKALRDRLGIRPGDLVAFSFEDGVVRVEPFRQHQTLRGRFRGSRLLEILEEDHRVERE